VLTPEPKLDGLSNPLEVDADNDSQSSGLNAASRSERSRRDVRISGT